MDEEWLHFLDAECTHGYYKDKGEDIVDVWCSKYQCWAVEAPCFPCDLLLRIIQEVFDRKNE